MELHFWLIPLMAIVVAGIAVFYLFIRRSGSSGVRSESRTLLDKPAKEDEVKAGWNFYGRM